MFQNFFEKRFIVIVHLVRWLFILLLCCAGIVIGAVILGNLGITDIEVPLE